MTLAAGILVLGLWTRTDIVRTARIVAAGYILVVLPPLLDRFVFRRAGRYEYAMPDDFVSKALTFFWNAPGAGKGIFVEIVVLLALAVAYAFLKTSSWWRAAGASLSLYAVFAVVRYAAALPADPPYERSGGPRIPPHSFISASISFSLSRSSPSDSLFTGGSSCGRSRGIRCRSARSISR